MFLKYLTFFYASYEGDLEILRRIIFCKNVEFIVLTGYLFIVAGTSNINGSKVISASEKLVWNCESTNIFRKKIKIVFLQKSQVSRNLQRVWF